MHYVIGYKNNGEQRYEYSYFVLPWGHLPAEKQELRWLGMQTDSFLQVV